MFYDQVRPQGGATREREGLLPGNLEALQPSLLGYDADGKVMTLFSFVFSRDTLSDDMHQGLWFAAASSAQHRRAHLGRAQRNIRNKDIGTKLEGTDELSGAIGMGFVGEPTHPNPLKALLRPASQGI